MDSPGAAELGAKAAGNPLLEGDPLLEGNPSLEGDPLLEGNPSLLVTVGGA